jgi:hypothetical protein
VGRGYFAPNESAYIAPYDITVEVTHRVADNNDAKPDEEPIESSDIVADFRPHAKGNFASVLRIRVCWGRKMQGRSPVRCADV